MRTHWSLRVLLRLAVALAAVSSPGPARAAEATAGHDTPAPDWPAAATRTRTLLAELIAADTSNPPGNEARAAAIGARRLKAAGIPFEILEFAPGRANLVARLRGSGRARPLLLLAHSDVVGTEGQTWAHPPHQLTESDGYLYGRGSDDDLGMAAVELETLLLLHAAGVPLARDVILAWTGDEESGGDGIRWLLEHRPDTIDAAIAINEGGGLRLDARGRPQTIELQTAEKTYQDFTLRASGTTGHSSVPLADNAIVRLARAVGRVGNHTFPARLLPVTRAYFAARAASEEGAAADAMRLLAATSFGPLPEPALGQLEVNPVMRANLRTTCVPTLLRGGTRVNALPASAEAVVNCRILPDETPADVQAALVALVGDSGIEIVPSDEFGHGEPSPTDGILPAALGRVVAARWPNVEIVPFMSRGASDSRFLRARGVAAYGVSPIGITEADAQRAHGIDERIPAASLQPALEMLYALVVDLAAGPGAVDDPAAPAGRAPDKKVSAGGGDSR